tara:strand:- start:1947 stop:2339 length:393 start_codon:yes stop_codon:yes gene_type:complete
MLNKIVIVKRDKFTVLPSLERYLYGEYTIVTKCKAGFASVSTVKASSPYEVFRGYKKDAIMNISFNSGSNRFTVYARTGKKVWACEELLREITVGDINDGGVMYKTSLYSQEQYQAVNAKSWADKAYVMN